MVLFLFVVLAPFGKKSTINQSPVTNFPTPTLVEINPPSPNPTISVSDFTGVLEVTIPQPTVDAANQKRSLRDKLPLTLSTFSIDFDYREDKFIVTLNEPKDAARTEFDNWLKSNYPAVNINQFNFK
jgi:hypothetical protein